jgi:2,4-dienoyl-CoA reductase (NADPH2)
MLKNMLKALFSPVTINKLVVPNRLMMSGMHLGMENVIDIYERMAHFFSLRAKGGVGLIVVGGCSPNTAGKGRLKGNFSIESDDQIRLHQKITDAIHRYDSRTALQICHFGRESFHGKNVSASAVRAEGILYKPKEMSQQVILQTITEFGKAAQRAQAAGYDAVEIVGSQGFLLHQFLSRATNIRQDQWGGRFENRLRFTLEVLKAVRQQVGNDFPIIYRLPALDLIDHGSSLEEVKTLHQQVLKAGIDMINVGIGWHDSKMPTIAMTVPRAAFCIVARSIKHLSPSHIPIAVSNRINDPIVAEELLINKTADIIAMGRPLLADPDLLSKSRDNRFEKINTCIACNQGCLDHALKGKRVMCMVNPNCGSAEEGHYERVRRPKCIGVIGGGIGGMSAALTLAKRGHRVSLFEQGHKLGGQLLLAAKVPGKSEFLETIRYFQNSLIDLDVNIYLNRKITPMDFVESDFDHLIFATGCIPKRIELEGSELDHVYSFDEILKFDIPVTPPVIVVGAGAIAINTAYYLKKKENRLIKRSERFLLNQVPTAFMDEYRDADHFHPQLIMLNRSGKKMGRTIGPTTRWIWIQKILQSGIKVINRVKIIRILENQIEIEPIKGSCVKTKKYERQILPARTVILAVGQIYDNRLARMVSELGVPYSVVGPVETKSQYKYNALIAIQEGDRIAKRI